MNKAITSIFLAYLTTSLANGGEAFPWPDGKEVAVSLSFDDARASEVHVGFELLRRLRLKATFYITTSFIPMNHIEYWKQAISEGHEIANHTETHPCEPRTIEQMELEIDRANRQIKNILGVTAQTFAYPCGNTWVGNTDSGQSYKSLVGKNFVLGRGYRDPPTISEPNDPVHMDFQDAQGTAFDDMNFERMKEIVTEARKGHKWVIFVGHEIGAKGYQVTDITALERLAAYLKDDQNKVWVGTVHEVASYIQNSR